MKMGPDALGTTENDCGCANPENGTQRPRYRRKRVRESKTCKRDLTPSERQKTSPSAQNMKTGTDTLGSVENESGRAKHENGSRCPRYGRKRFRARKGMNTGLDSLVAAENESERKT
jgi:hypothetical protein